MVKKSDVLQKLLSWVLALAILLTNCPMYVLALEDETAAHVQERTYSPLYQEITVQPGQLVGDTGGIVENEIYGYVVDYELKKGHILSISNTDYVFSVRQLVDGNYSTMLKQATTDSFTAAEDMTVGMLIRKPDKSALTAEELASIVIYDSQYGMIGVEGYAHRFTVEAETIDGGTATTRGNIFLPADYSEDGEPTKLIVMTNGYSAYLTDSVWNGNTAANVGIIQSYLDAGYAVWVVDNTAARTAQTPDLGCPQLVDSYLKAYEFIQEHFNVEQKFSIHSRSFGTFAAMRIMQEVPELIKCAVMTGPRVSIEIAWGYVDKTFVANHFGFADTTGATYEADKLVGYDPYTDVDGDSYALPPTFWMMCEGDATAEPLEVIEKLTEHGNDVTSKTYTGTNHTGICTLNTEYMFADALAFLEEHQEETLEGKTISILGASISTYAGTSNGAAADSSNSTIRNNVKYYPNTTIPEVTLTDTWWMQVADDLGLRLLVNNAWSGSAILLERSGTVGAYVDRCVQLHDDTGDNAGEEPDIICIQMGFNDFSYGKDTLGTSDIDYDALITADGYQTPATTMEATAIMLDKMVKRYPNAEIYMFNHFKRIGQSASDTELMEQLNADIETVCARFGVKVVDLYTAMTQPAHIGDGRLHPNCLGMDVISEAVKRTLVENTAYSVHTHTVSMELDNVTADYGDDKIVVDGDSFTLNLTPVGDDVLDVTVTMGGADITASAYADGTVSIDAVTADVTITAESVHMSRNYRWEFDGTELVSAGETENTLTKNAGTTTDGVFSNTRYALDKTVILSHDQPWVVEWECQGSWRNSNSSSGGRMFTTTDVNADYDARYIFKSANSWLIAMGEKDTAGSHNYGIALEDYGIDGSALHTYRLENHIAADGSNMVWLYVDGEEIGPMNNYYVGTTDKNTTSDWLSGKDFVFPYMGTDTHGFTNCSVAYIQVWEGGKPEQSLAGKTISILGDSISTYTGVSDDASVNATLSGGAIYYTPGRWDIYQEDTWWQQTIDALDLRLLVNNSWSGSCVLHTRRGTVGAYVDRCVNLHNDATGEEPEVIAVFLGTNDFSYYQSALGTADIDYDALITENADGAFTYATPTTTCEAYAIMLHKMTNRYSDAEIYCMTLTARRDPDKEDNYADVGQPTAFNAELAEIIEKFGCTVVDLENCGIDKEAAVFDTYFGDGRVHPNAKGMDKITEALVEAMLGRETTLYSVSYDLQNVTADTNAKTVIEGGEFSAVLEMNEGCDKLKVSVTMGGEDVTEVAYSDGKVTLSNITGDIVITASAVKPAENYRWEFDGSDLVSVSDTGNALTKLGGSTENGLLVNIYYSMDRSVTLYHDREWSVEFKASGSWSGMLFSSLESAGTEGNTFMFKTTSDSGLIAFGERSNSQYHNYGVPLTSLGVDTTEEHTYKLENRIAEDGSNMVYLLVDGVDYGAMNSYFIGGTNNQNKTVDWLSGKDFTFRYIGAASHPINNCELEYLAVWEGGNTTEQMPMRYDDHYDVTGKTVEIIDAGTPTSYKVGYGVAEGTLDDAVVTLDGDTLVATGIGTAIVRIDGTLYEITVSPAPISLLLLAGQSNMQGSEGNADQSIVCPDGMVYSTYGDRYTMTVDNATNYAPSALTGAGSALNVNGTTTNLEDWPVYLLNEAGAGKMGPDSGFAYEWVQQTGEKVWIVNAAHGGSSITTWQKTGANYKEAVALFSACQQTLQKEIDAGHFTLSHMGYFWCQGCTDYSQSAEWYVEKYLAMHDNLKTELAFSEDVTFEFGGIIPVRAGHEYYTSYRQGVYADTTTAKYHESFKDLRFTGPRVAQYWMGNNPELEDIWVVCNIGESWVTMPDGTDDVSEYFQAHYPNGTVDYTTQVQQSESWYTPTTPAAVHDSIHYNQIGYNEVGREAVRNALIYLGEIEAPEVETTVDFLTWDGYTPVEEVTASTAGNSGTLVVPMVYPLWKAKKVTYQVSEGLCYEYYDLLADSMQTTGELHAVGAQPQSVSVKEAESGSHFEDHLQALPDALCSGVNLWDLLEHDKYYYANGTGWGTHSSGTVYSVTIPIDPGDKIYASSFGAAGTNGSSSSNGIRVTFFSEYGVAKTMAPSEVYPEFTANGGYLVAPEGAIAVNIPMWTNSDEWEIFILNREHDTSSDICSICGKSSHTHDWSDWETVSEPTADALGVEQRICASCGETETREVEGVWQTLKLSEHMAPMPESYCAGTNLWPLLEHDEEFFSPGTQWHVHSSGTVYSVTVPVNAGDMIYASSFGKGGTHGSSSNGIRVTFFDAYGVAKTLAPADTYAEFTANGGYLIAPEGTVAINVPMWTNSDEWELYILNREHTYSGTTCTICGAEHPEAADYTGKVISILGDSISTFAGYIPTADGFNLEHIARYPQDNLLTDVNETWWMQVLTSLDAKLGINESWRSTEVGNIYDVEVNSGYEGTKACMASLTRIQNLGSNGTPDVILFYGGTNDITQRRTVGTFDPDTAPTEVDLTSVKWDTVADAYVATIMRMQHYYPDAEIIAMLPTYTSNNTDAVLEKYNSVFAAICEHYGVTYIDLRDCGITTADLPDGTHPDAEGMDYITNAVLDTLLNECEMEAGENVVYSVTHSLTGAQSSLSYYKGVSAGKSFVTDVTGEDLTVAVTMGGVDITASVYAGGVVNIPSVTGDIVITAGGVERPVYADHLQQLPENICPGVNLWTALEPENVYYTASGWGNLANGQVWSVTIPLSEGDRIYATSFEAYGANGNASSTSSGIRVTFFDAYGVAKTLTPADTYAEFIANGGYLTAPEGTVAVNVPMWNNSDENELYILNREHSYESAVTAPTCTEQGYATHTCSVCGDSYVDGYVDATGHSYGDWTFVDDDTRERVCDFCSDADRIYRLTLPTKYSGFIYVENNHSGFYAGTRNVAELLGLKSGTFTDGEVTVTIAGTNVTVSGTPTKNLYFDLQTGEFGTPDYKRDVGYSLPDGDYRFGINGSGTRAPTVCIRYPDGSGNLMTASHSTGVHTVSNVNGEDFGVPYLYFSKDAAYDFSGNLVLAMGSDAVYDNQISQVETIQGTGEFTVDGYLWTTDETVKVFGYPVSSAEKENQLVYIPGSKEYIQIYLPQEEGYLQIRMNLANSTSTNAYGWRLDMMYACDDNYNEIFPITQSGEYEAAIKLKGRSDFMGMGAHGSERMTSFAIYVDGEEVTLEQLTELTQWETVKMVRYSDFYDPADESTVVAHHAVEYHFDGTGLTVDQDVEWLVEETCAISYMMMFPVRRTYENLQITDTYFDDFDSSEYDVSQPDFKTYPANWTAGATKLTLYSEKSGVTASMESLETSELTGTGYKNCSNSSSYNKLYFTICGGGGTEQGVTAGDVWSTSTRYEVILEKGTDVDNSCIFGHQYTSVITDPTCTEQGYTTHTCVNCSDSYVDSYVNAAGHSYGEWTVTKAATCTEDGTERRDCANCDHYETRTIEATGHDYESTVTAPTCMEQGYTTYTCVNCGDSYMDSYVNAAGHSYGVWSIVKTATCTEDGTERRDCANCDHYEIRVIEATGHDYESTVTAPTCMEQGYTTYTCVNCGDSYEDAYVSATGHSYGAWIVTNAATCTEDGTERRDCTNCDHYETRTIEATGHDYESVVTEPTCTEQGYTTHTCVNCSDSYVDSYVNAAGHSYGAWTVTNAATCTEAGTGRRDCANCDHYETRTIEATGHDYESVVTAPTCTEQGYTTHTCAYCSDSYVNSYVPETGHSLGDWNVITKPTCTEEGEERRDCVDCDHYETRKVDATDHSFEEGYCTECGERDDSYTPGDINGDGSVNNKDLTRLFQYLSDWDVEVNEAALDINGDGQVNNKDLTRLFQYLSDWDVEIY